MKIKGVLCLMTFICLSCSNKKDYKSSDSFERLDMINNNNIKDLEDVVEESFFVKLEATNKSNLRYITDVKITDKLIFICDVGSQSIFVFSFPEGKFVNEINALGVGPQEYRAINDFEINENEKTIEILDSNQKNIIKYTFGGEYVETNKISFTGAMEFIHSDNGLIYFSGLLREEKKGDLYQLYNTDKGSIEDKFFEVEKEYSFLTKPPHNLISSNSIAYFVPLYSPFIFQLDDNEIVKKYFLDFGNNWVDEKILYEVHEPSDYDKAIDQNNYVKTINTVIGNNFITITYYLKNKHHLSLYNAKTKNLYYIRNFDKGILQNNTFGYYHDKYFISIKDPIKILEAYKKGEINTDTNIVSKEFISNIDEGDNQILMFTKFKENFN